MLQETLISQYLDLYDSKINMVLSLFVEKFGLRNPVKKWWNGLIDKSGYLDAYNQVEYFFHGGGCSVYLANEEVVSFDFDENDDYGFDNFKFLLFLESTHTLREHKPLLENIDSLTLDVGKRDGRFVLKRILAVKKSTSARKDP